MYSAEDRINDILLPFISGAKKQFTKIKNNIKENKSIEKGIIFSKICRTIYIYEKRAI